MHRLRIYLDTSVISLLFQDEAGERQEVSRDFFLNIVSPRIHDVFISAVVLEEISRTPDLKRREAMVNIVRAYQLPLLAFDPADDVLLRLASLYIELGIIPSNKRRDALHVAVATIHEMDMLATWNYRHLAGVDREARIALANVSSGFTKPLRLITPLEVAYP